MRAAANTPVSTDTEVGTRIGSTSRLTMTPTTVVMAVVRASELTSSKEP